MYNKKGVPIDISGQIRGNLKVISFSHMEPRKNDINRGRSFWKCVCTVCNKEVILTKASLRTQKSCSRGCTYFKQFLDKLDDNKKIGNLTFLEGVFDKRSLSGGMLAKFICDCGKVVEKDIYRVTEGSVTSCGCKHHPSKSKHPRWKGFGEISEKYWYGIIKNTKRKTKNLECTITKEFAWNLYLNQNRKCALMGIDIIFGKGKEATASLDRIDSNIGYIPTNIQWVHKTVNLMKMALDQTEFIKFCKLIANNN